MINSAQLKALSVFSIFALIGFGPVSPACLIGLYIVWKRPEWFRVLVGRIYKHPKDDGFVTAAQTRKARLKSCLSLILLLILDIAPVPVTPMLAFFIILARPMWFYGVVRRVYGEIA